MEAAADPGLEPGLPPVLGGQDADPVNPLVLFVGSPLYVLYLRALGAKIGRGVAIFSRSVPVCTDLLTIGDGTVIRKDSFFTCYRAHDGMIQIGAVTLGRDVFVGEATVLDIGTSMGDGAQLGHYVLAAHRAGGARRRALARFAGPADRGRLPDGPHAAVGTARRVVFAARAAAEPARWCTAAGVRHRGPRCSRGPAARRAAGRGTGGLHDWAFYRDAWSSPPCCSSASCWSASLVVVTVPRLLNLVLRPDRVYPLYGIPLLGPPGDRAR